MWTGAGYSETNWGQIQKEQQKAIDDDKQRRLDTWIKIDQLIADAKRKLEDKYKERF